MASKNKDTTYIMVSMVAGLFLGLMIYFSASGDFGDGIKPLGSILLSGIELLKPIGTVFIRLLKMVIVPLVFSSIFMAMVNLGTPEALGSMGRKAVIYYFVTTAMAVLFGLIFVNLINPGVGASLGGAGLEGLSSTMSAKVQGQDGLYNTIVGVLVEAIPSNPASSMSNGTVLQIIVFSIFLGVVALYKPQEAQPIINVIRSLEKLTLTLTHWIMKLAHIGIFVLMLDIMSKAGFTAILSLSKYMLTVLVGLLCHALLLLFIASARLKRSPIFIIKGIAQALLTAFSTASSAATLPITMANVEDNLGVRKETAEFVLPLGATINMDGTALYESVAAIFIAQAYQIDLSIGQQVIIFMTASLAAVGAAAIPGAGLVTMSIVLTAVGLPLEGIGLILAVDRILDMFRTTVNVFGDSVGTIVVDSLLKSEAKT
ncbi:MAG: dicarboxylate/amino acid:cation symporter [Bdellovibrionales bacterium]|nr:dicarboxylate/amino acid:cation symporter [Bdellovibrionales bacterium]